MLQWEKIVNSLVEMNIIVTIIFVSLALENASSVLDHLIFNVRPARMVTFLKVVNARLSVVILLSTVTKLIGLAHQPAQ